LQDAFGPYLTAFVAKTHATGERHHSLVQRRRISTCSTKFGTVILSPHSAPFSHVFGPF
jgi:hypothetical protein